MYTHYIIFLDFLIYSITILIINYMYYLFLGMAVPDSAPELNRNFHTYRMCHTDMTLISRPLVFACEKEVDWYFIVKIPSKIHLVH